MSCQSCRGTKNLGVNSYKGNRIYYICRSCNTKRHRKYRNTENGMRKVREAVYRSVKKHKIKQKARKLLQHQIKMGHIIRPKKCDECLLRRKVAGHHEDYSKPLDVMWLCADCHLLKH